ncbi:unnamed protein product, partial [Musa textilis]
QRHARRFHVGRRQPKAPLQFVDHRPPTGVDAEVLERALEFRDVQLPPPRAPQASRHQGRQEAELLRDRQHQRSYGCDVRPERLARDHHQILVESDPGVAFLVLLLGHAAIGPVVRALVGAHHVEEAVLGAGALPAAIGEEHSRAAHSEEAVR